MSRYIEEFRIGGQRYSIEDYEDGASMEEHFFGHNYRKGKDARFRLWRNGGGFGRATTLKRARTMLRDYAAENLRQVRNKAQTDMHNANGDLVRLGTDIAHLFRFEVEDDS